MNDSKPVIISTTMDTFRQDVIQQSQERPVVVGSLSSVDASAGKAGNRNAGGILSGEGECG
jgi:hypothetical protein